MKKLWQEPEMLSIHIEATETFGFGGFGNNDFNEASGQTGTGCNGFNYDHYSDFMKKLKEWMSNKKRH